MPRDQMDFGAQFAPPDARSLPERIAGLAELPIGELREAWSGVWIARRPRARAGVCWCSALPGDGRPRSIVVCRASWSAGWLRLKRATDRAARWMYRLYG